MHRFAILPLWICLVSAWIAARSTKADLLGVVRDPSGLLVSLVDVELVNPQTEVPGSPLP